MKVVECINDTHSNVLVKGKQYFAFPTGNPSTFYISNFKNVRSNMGEFQTARFKEVIAAEETTPLYRIYYNCENKVYECYGFKSKNNLVALYVDQKLERLVGTLPEEKVELLEAIGKVKKRYVMPTPITLQKLAPLEMLDDVQLSLF